MENREAAARRAVKFRIQIGIAGKQAPDDSAVDSIELAVRASGRCSRIRRAREKTDFADIIPGTNKAGRLLPRMRGVLADLKNAGADDEKSRVGSPLREKYLPWLWQSRRQVSG